MEEGRLLEVAEDDGCQARQPAQFGLFYGIDYVEVVLLREVAVVAGRLDQYNYQNVEDYEEFAGCCVSEPRNRPLQD